MPNYSDKETDRVLAELERRLVRMYGQASNEMADKVNEYYTGWDEVKNGKVIHHKGLDERYDEEYQAYKEGKYTKEEFTAWYASQIGRGERMATMRDQMADRMVKANEVASAYVNDKTPGIYTLNHNYSCYQIESVHKNVSFALVDENTVKRLVHGKNHVNFRVLRVDRVKDYRWNKLRITHALQQGIIQGEHPYKIAKRFLNVMGSDQAAAIRNARTAFTSAQNGGRMDSYEKAAAMGIEIEKEWLATRDARTRDSHINANGQRKPWDKPFKMDHGELMYPGDPAGHPAEVYNCRCTLVPVLPKVEKYLSTDDESKFKEWMNEQKVPKMNIGNIGLDIYSKDEIEKIANKTQKLADKYVSKKTKWSGILNINPDSQHVGKEWDCSITLRNETSPHIILHEQLHAKSISYYDAKMYLENNRIEEAVVQFVNQEISKIEGIKIIESAYDDDVDVLRKVSKALGKNDIDFSIELLDKKVDERIDWIQEMIYNNDKLSIQEVMELYDMVEELR